MKLSSKIRSQVTSLLAFFVVSLAVFACTPTANDSGKSTVEAVKPEAVAATPVTKDMTPPSLPVQYQKPAYLVDSSSKNDLDNKEDDAVFKVGATISSKKRVPLVEIMKPLAKLKKLNISWADDVKQDLPVDVDIQANDDFYKAVENILRQLDYFYEIDGSTIVIKGNESIQYHVAMPFTKQDFSTGTGGNVLGGDVGGEGIAKNVEGTIKLVSEKNEFDIWKNIQSNMDSILDVKRTRTRTETEAANASIKEDGQAKARVEVNSSGGSAGGNAEGSAKGKKDADSLTRNVIQTSIDVTSTKDSYYFIDKPIGLITVYAPRSLQKRVKEYFTSLQNELYKQISIEAKIIEVLLVDNSSIGINWDSVLKNFQVTGQVGFGNNGSIFSWDPTTGSTSNRIVSNVTINTLNFEAFLNALKTQGNTKVLSNPKLSVLNGQPAMITVGQNITYIDKIEVDVDTETNTRTYTAETANILSGVGMALTANILNDNEIVLNLVPVTSELQGEIEYRNVGEGEVGLPVVNVREMSTTVRVKNNDMLVIGGLISDVNQDDDNFAPVLGDIPLVKYLFGHSEKVKSKRELIIILKPRII